MAEESGVRRGGVRGAGVRSGGVSAGDGAESHEPGSAGDGAESHEPGSAEEAVDHEPGSAEEADALLELGDRIATLAAHIHAATHRLLVMLAEFDRRGGWKAGGYTTCAHWLAFRTGLTMGAARERVRAARALESLPETSAAMARGELSFAKVRAITRVARPESEADLVEYARGTTAAGVERMVRSWKIRDRKDEAEYERELHRSRTFAVFPDEDGMYLVRGRLDAEVGALLMRAIEAASDVLYRAERRWGGGECEGEVGRRPVDQLRDQVLRRLDLPGHEETSAAQRRADAVGLLAERVLGVGFGVRGGGASPGGAPPDGVPAEGMPANGVPADGAPTNEVPAAWRPTDEDTAAERPGAGADGGRAPDVGIAEAGGVEDAESHDVGIAAGGHDDAERSLDPGAPTPVLAAPISGTRAERYQVVLHVDADTLSADQEPGRSHLADGTRVSAETSRRLACDAGVVWVKRSPDGKVLDIGRRRRTVPPATRRALEVRDQGCRFPGCGSRYTDAHHITHWADGGRTCLENLVLLCRRHHRLLHEEGFRIEQDAGGDRVTFFDPRGRQVPDRPPRIRLSGRAVEALERENRRTAGTAPEWSTAGARYRREADIPLELEGRAREAVAGGV